MLGSKRNPPDIHENITSDINIHHNLSVNLDSLTENLEPRFIHVFRKPQSLNLKNFLHFPPLLLFFIGKMRIDFIYTSPTFTVSLVLRLWWLNCTNFFQSI